MNGILNTPVGIGVSTLRKRRPPLWYRANSAELILKIVIWSSAKIPSRVLVACLLFVPACSYAVDADCPAEDKPMSRQMDCAHQKWQEVDAEMNSTYEQVLDRLKGKVRELSREDADKSAKQLIEAQKVWRKFLDADCAGRYTINGGGDGSRYADADCTFQHTADRLRDLRQYLQEVSGPE